MSKLLVFEDGRLIQDIASNVLWAGLFSVVSRNGKVIHFIQNNLPKNTICVIPISDGNIKQYYGENEYIADVNWNEIQQYRDYATLHNKIFILGVLSHVGKEAENVNYLYIPLDDGFFEWGATAYFPHHTLPLWKDRNSELCWRGGCSGINGKNSIRSKFVKTLFNYEGSQNVRFSSIWSENKNIPPEHFADRLIDRINYTDFLKYKIFFIVDGNVIASNHMWGFASGCVPFLISNAKCWFSDFIVPYAHYIPVHYDLSNLIEQIEYIKNNDVVAEKIAYNARQFAQTYFSPAFQQKYLLENINKYAQK